MTATSPALFDRPSTASFGTLRRHWTAVACGAALALLAFAPAVRAAPSGGPYGPVQLRYELPAAKHLIFVAPDGKPGQPGTLAAPTTLDAAIDRVETGDAIIMRGGVYRTGNLLLNQGVTIQPYGDEQPVVKGTAIATKWEEQPNGLWRATWTTLFPAKPADWWRRQRHGRDTPLCLFNNDMVFVDGEMLQAVDGEPQVNEHTYSIDYDHNAVYIGFNPANHVIEITTHDGALVRTTRDVHGRKSDGRGPVIRGIVFTQFAYRALEVEGKEPERLADPATFGKEVTGTTLENVTISYCSRAGAYLRGDRLTVRHCLVSDTSTEGLYVIDSADVLLEGNIFRHNNIEKIEGYFPAAVKIFNQSYRVTCRNNLIIDNPNSSGVWYDVGNVDAVFVDNWVENADQGFFFEISKGAICAGNVFINCGNGIRILNSSNVQVCQNTFVDSVAWFERTERSAVGDHFGWHPSTGPDVTERHGHVFVNNLLVADERYRGPLLALEQSPAVRDRLKDSQLKELDGNVYVRRFDPAGHPLIVWSPAPNEASRLEFASLEDLRKQYPQFGASSRYLPDYHGPLFQGLELRRLELMPGFPAASTAVPLPEKVAAVLGVKAAPAYPGAYAPVRE